MKRLHSVLLLITLPLFLLAPLQATAQGLTPLLVPIAVGDITIFVPVSGVSIDTQTQTTGGDIYDLTWPAVGGAHHYQLEIQLEGGAIETIRVDGLTYSLAGLPLGSGTVSLLSCNSSNVCTDAVFVGNFSVNESIKYVHTDTLGSPIMEMDQAANVRTEKRYKPYGETESGSSEGIGYTGHMEDVDAGLTYMEARYYDSVLGRFYSIDPIGYTTSNPMMFARYAYANNSPYRYVDPEGMAPQGAFETSSDIMRRIRAGHSTEEIRLDNQEAGLKKLTLASLVIGPEVLFGLKLAGGAYRIAAAPKGGVDDLVKVAGGKARPSGDIVVDGGSKKAKDLFRQFDAKGAGSRGFQRDKSGGGRQVVGETATGDSLRLRFKPDGTTRIQAGKQKFIFPKTKK